MVPDWIFGGLVIQGITDHLAMVFSPFMNIFSANFQPSSSIANISRTSMMVFGGHGLPLARYLEERVILQITYHHYLRFFICVPNFSSLA